MGATISSEEDAVRALHADDPVGLEWLVASYRRALVRYAEDIIGGADGGEDVVQEAFYRLWTHRHDVDPPSSVRAYLYVLTRNAAIDERRRGARRTAVARYARSPWHAPDPLDCAAASDLAGAAADATAALPARRREVFRLARFEGLTYREIGAKLGVSPQTVANQMSYALRSLRDALVDFDVTATSSSPGAPENFRRMSGVSVPCAED